MYASILFPNHDTTTVVPSTWITTLGTTSYCYWPPSDQEDILHVYVRDSFVPAEDWILKPCTVKTYKDVNIESVLVEQPIKIEPTSSELEFNTKHILDDEEGNDTWKLPSKKIKSCSTNGDPGFVAKVTENVSSESQPTQSSDLEQISQHVSNLKAFMKYSFKSINDKIDSLYNEQMNACAEISEIKEALIKQNYQTESLQTETLDVFFMVSLPIKTMEEFDNLEQELMNLDNKSGFIRKLSTFGGNHLRSVVHSIMNGIFDNHLSVQFSLHGRKGKRKFASTNTFDCVVDAVKQNPHGLQEHESKIVEIIGKNLIYAKDRLSGRKCASSADQTISDEQQSN